MLCSVPGSKSGSNWLDRLRSNKGFPSGDNFDLDLFLSRNPTTTSSEYSNGNASASIELTRPDTDQVANRSESSNQDNQGEALMGLMDNVLSELFFMGGSDESSKLSGKKIARKQTNPRVCMTSTTNSNSNTPSDNVTEEKSSEFVRNGENALQKTGSLNSENKKELENAGCGEGEEVGAEEGEEKGEMREMQGYSRSEVTVIDTSCRIWKTEKVVFRRKSVWKVREKKVKVRGFGRHKRKVVDEAVVVEACDDDIDKKKAKVSALEEECVALNSIRGQKSQNDTSNEVRRGAPDNLNDRGKEFPKGMPDNKSKDSKKGFLLNRSPRKMKKGDSSVILIKGIPTDNKNGGKIPRKCLKEMQKQYRS